MSDMIDGNKFVYTYQPAWHGKGNKIEPGISIRDGVIKCGLDYEVVKAPMYYHYREHDGRIGHGFAFYFVLKRIKTQQAGTKGFNYETNQNRGVLLVRFGVVIGLPGKCTTDISSGVRR